MPEILARLTCYSRRLDEAKLARVDHIGPSKYVAPVVCLPLLLLCSHPHKPLQHKERKLSQKRVCLLLNEIIKNASTRIRPVCEGWRLTSTRGRAGAGDASFISPRPLLRAATTCASWEEQELSVRCAQFDGFRDTRYFFISSTYPTPVRACAGSGVELPWKYFVEGYSDKRGNISLAFIYPTVGASANRDDK